MTIVIQNGKVFMQGREWSQLSTSGKIFTALAAAAQVIAGIIQIALLIAALADIRRRPAAQIRGKKWVWALVSFVDILGPLAYFRFGRIKAAELLPQAAADSLIDQDKERQE